jgi:hypothetical protein
MHKRRSATPHTANRHLSITTMHKRRPATPHTASRHLSITKARRVTGGPTADWGEYVPGVHVGDQRTVKFGVPTLTATGGPPKPPSPRPTERARLSRWSSSVSGSRSLEARSDDRCAGAPMEAHPAAIAAVGLDGDGARGDRYPRRCKRTVTLPVHHRVRSSLVQRSASPEGTWPPWGIQFAAPGAGLTLGAQVRTGSTIRPVVVKACGARRSCLGLVAAVRRSANARANICGDGPASWRVGGRSC